MRRLLAIPIIVVALVLAAAPVVADPPTEVAGHWDYALLGPPDVRVAGQNTFVHAMDEGTWTGSFVGTSIEEFVVVEHRNHAFYKGEMVFEGCVGDACGMMTIKTNGTLVYGQDWVGHWVIQDATDGLEGLHGNGTFTGPPFSLDYKGQINFRG